jgi:uncharacterized protein (TIGR02246 family)
MSKSLNWLMSLLLVPLVFAACVLAAPNDEEEVRKAVGGFSESWNHHDMEALGGLFATDADFVNLAGEWLKGRKEIQTEHAYLHGTIPADTKGFEGLRNNYGILKTSTIRFTQIDVRFLQRDVALAHASWEMFVATQTPKPRYGLFTFVLTRQNRVWLIATSQNIEINRTVK